MTDQLPADIAEAINKVTGFASAYGFARASDKPPFERGYCKARNALEALILKHLGEWRSISDLPDGTTHALISDGHTVGEGFWHDGKGCHRAGPGWFWEMDRGDLLTAKNAYVTHWRPIPDPPAALAQHERSQTEG